MIRLLALSLILTLFTQNQMAAKEVIDADTTDFVTASILHIGPGEDIYSACGHMALRMQCPIHGLDISFSYLVPDESMLVAHTVFGQSKQGLVRIPTSDYLSEITNEGRSVDEYELNLTDAEKKKLWQLLDQESERGAYLDYDYINHGCALGLAEKVRQALIDDEFDIKNASDPEPCRAIVSRHLETRPWEAFWMSFMLGEKVNSKCDSLCLVMLPADLVNTWQYGDFASSSGDTRPILIGGKSLARSSGDRHSHLTPLLAAILLLVWGVFTAIIRCYGCKDRLVKWSVVAYDALMLVILTSLGILIASIIIFSDLYGTEWNWQILTYNIAPLCGYIMRRKWPSVANYIFAAYIIAVLTYLLITSLYVTQQAQLLLPGWIIAITAVIWSSSIINIKHNNS